ncbi:putative polysaccharide biosynthesis protein [Parasporobacterium paucivorans]|uniref:Stage V sporulation protein B n=1 Tax=Parasporobacterium paucivorans DSM 15970 TaxID=1122934 RepID=A0A1M6A1D0_9FIRM|nr:polysaccharide biosynthesis protein [Parasporobacterium paucivorans]SHI30302.1 stage V sporulation protein B [Parasporobacterium paucivorans DSM 15970]
MSNNKNHSSFIIQGSILAVSSVMVRIIGLMYRIPLTNILGNKGMGIYGIAFDMYSILLLISSYSLPLAVSKLVSARVAKGQIRNSHRIFLGAIRFSLSVGLVVGAFAYFCADLLARLWLSPESAIAFRILAPTLVIMSVLGVFRGYFQGLGTMIPTALSNIFEQIVNAVVSVAAAKYLFDFGRTAARMKKDFNYPEAYGSAGGTLGTALGALTALILLIIVYFSYKKVIRRKLRKDMTEENESYGFILKILILTIMPVILSTTIYNISTFLDSGFYNNIMAIKGMDKNIRQELLGMYTGKYRLLVNVPVALASALASSMIPSISASIATGNRGQVVNKINLVLRFCMMITIPSAVGMAVLAKPIINLLFPGAEGVDTTVLMMQTGAISIIFYSISTLTNGILQGINHMRIPVRHSFISLIVHVVLISLLLYFTDLNIFAVVISDVLFAVVITILNARSLYHYLEYRQEKVMTFVLPALSSVIMGAAAYFAYHLMYPAFKASVDSAWLSNAIPAILSIILAVIIYSLCLLLFKVVDVHDIEKLPKGKKLAYFLRRIHLLRD